jgi:hypothetical protein
MKNSLRKEFIHKLNIRGDIMSIFRLFCPIVEKSWVPGWECNILYSETGIAEKNCVFSTKHANMPENIWICSIYNLGIEVEYIRITPEYFVTVINIKTLQVSDITQCNVKYTHTALTEGGSNFVESHFTEELFIKQIDSWQDEISAYLQIKNYLPNNGNSF